MLTIEITSVNIAYSKGAVSGVNINFISNHDQRTINLNGYVPLTFEAYTPIANDVVALQSAVKDKVLAAIEGMEESL